MQRLTVTRYTTFFFFNDTATTEIYTLSLHDALPISDGRGHRLRIAQGVLTRPGGARRARRAPGLAADRRGRRAARGDRKSTRLNSSHVRISYAVFCLKKKKHIIKSLPAISTMRKVLH